MFCLGCRGLWKWTLMLMNKKVDTAGRVTRYEMCKAGNHVWKILGCTRTKNKDMGIWLEFSPRFGYLPCLMGYDRGPAFALFSSLGTFRLLTIPGA